MGKILLKFLFPTLITVGLYNWVHVPNSSVTSIQAIYDNPEYYQNIEITVYGTVYNKFVWFGKTTFGLNDGSAKSLLVHSKRNPTNGEQVFITGKVNIIFDVGNLKIIELSED